MPSSDLSTHGRPAFGSEQSFTSFGAGSSGTASATGGRVGPLALGGAVALGAAVVAVGEVATLAVGRGCSGGGVIWQSGGSQLDVSGVREPWSLGF